MFSIGRLRVSVTVVEMHRHSTSTMHSANIDCLVCKSWNWIYFRYLSFLPKLSSLLPMKMVEKEGYTPSKLDMMQCNSRVRVERGEIVEEPKSTVVNI